ncbi:MAG: HPr kinase/phosphorylase, partial [Candidatus Acidiferrales bacterium]
MTILSNLPIPGINPSDCSANHADITLLWGVSPIDSHEIISQPEVLTYSSMFKDDAGEPILKIWNLGGGKFLRLAYPDGMQFWMDREGTKIWAVWPATSSLEDAASYLLGPILGLVLRLRGTTCLHASAVEIHGCAVIFPGEEGAGKSTTAAALARRGHAVLSDDVVALAERDGAFFVLPAYPYLSLWEDSVKMLYGAEDALPAFSPNFDKRMLSLAAHNLRFEKQALPLGAVFLLGDRSADDRAPWIEALNPHENLVSLVVNSYATNLLESNMREREFVLL